MTRSSSSVSTRGQALPKGAIKVTQQVKANLEELEVLRKQANELNKLANTLRKQILAEVGDDKDATLIFRNAVVGRVVVEHSKSVSKERLLQFRPDVFEELALPSKRTTLETK